MIKNTGESKKGGQIKERRTLETIKKEEEETEQENLGVKE